MTRNAELPLALDAMGGDLGVSPLLEGAVRAVVDDGVRVVVVGTADVGALLRRDHAALLATDRLAFVVADDVVTMDDKPAQAVRRRRRSSMRIACDLVAEGRCAGVLSTGNSGAMLAIASFVFGRLPGVLRPAIATLLPSLSPTRFTLLLDAGANTDCDAIHLAQWGVLGSAWLARTRGPARPVVGVLSNGEESHKGTALTRGALTLLQHTDVRLKGACEGRDLNDGSVDVVVTDGFTGNVVLKTAEGVFSFLSQSIKDTFQHGSVVDQLGGLLSKPGYARLRRTLDPREFGAAPLLGLTRPAFIAHGRSDAHAVRCGLRAVRTAVAADATDHLVAALARNPAVAPARSADRGRDPGAPAGRDHGGDRGGDRGPGGVDEDGGEGVDEDAA